MQSVGKKYWIIPDCELPPEGANVYGFLHKFWIRDHSTSRSQ